MIWCAYDQIQGFIAQMLGMDFFPISRGYFDFTLFESNKKKSKLFIKSYK